MQLSSPCIDRGTNLGATYDDGLDADSSWPDSVTTVNQDTCGPWDIGAYVLDGPEGYLWKGKSQMGLGLR